MARLNQGVLGQVEGKLGNGIFKVMRGKNYGAIYQPRVTNPQSEAQIAARNKFSAITNVLNGSYMRVVAKKVKKYSAPSELAKYSISTGVRKNKLLDLFTSPSDIIKVISSDYAPFKYKPINLIYDPFNATLNCKLVQIDQTGIDLVNQAEAIIAVYDVVTRSVEYSNDYLFTQSEQVLNGVNMVSCESRKALNASLLLFKNANSNGDVKKYWGSMSHNCWGLIDPVILFGYVRSQYVLAINIGSYSYDEGTLHIPFTLGSGGFAFNGSSNMAACVRVTRGSDVSYYQTTGSSTLSSLIVDIPMPDPTDADNLDVIIQCSDSLADVTSNYVIHNIY